MATEFKSKKGNLKKIIIAILVLSFVLAFFMLGYLLIFGSGSVIKNIDIVSSSDEELRKSAAKGTFEIENAKFHDSAILDEAHEINGAFDFEKTGDFCEQNDTLQPIILDILFTTKRVPERCNIFVNSEFIQAMQTDEPYCLGDCPNESLYTISLKKHDITSSHEIEVCCNSECEKKILDAPC